MSQTPKVLITGVGLVTPLGADRESTWQALLAGHRAVRHLPNIGPDWLAGSAAAVAVPSDRAAQACRDSDLSSLLTEQTIDHAASAALEAVEHAGIDWEFVDPARAACVIGTSKGGMHSWYRTMQSRRLQKETYSDAEQGTAKQKLSGRQSETSEPECPAAAWLRLAPDGPACTVASLFNLQAGALAPVTACATGLSSILRGAELIRSGHCDLVLAGSSDASVSPAVLASFRKLGVLASTNDDPAGAVRPFDRRRSGFVIGEGAGIVVLESETHAAARNAEPLAEWLTGGMVCAAAGLMQLEGEPEALPWLIRDVLRRSQVSPGQVDYISLHGTATKTNDLAEVRAIKAAFGPVAGQLSASSLKGAIGHLLGAAGSVELAATVLAIRDGRLPPTMNLTSPDNECDLDFVAGKSQACDVSHAMKLSLGFGGHLVAGIIRRPD